MTTKQESWCNRTFEVDFIAPIMKTCRADASGSVVITKKLFRAKRTLEEPQTTYIAARLPLIKDYVNTIAYNWKDGQVSDVLAKTLDLENHLPPGCPISAFTPHFCLYDLEDHQIILHLDQNLLHKISSLPPLPALLGICITLITLICYMRLPPRKRLMNRTVRFERIGEINPFEPLPPPTYGPERV